jgi:hypothetical protein
MRVSNWDLRPADRKNGLGNIDMVKMDIPGPSIIHRSIADEVRTHGMLAMPRRGLGKSYWTSRGFADIRWE